MPYRRLPNTDAARIRAMKTALETGMELPPHKMAFSGKTLLRLQKVLPQFENGINLKQQSIKAKTSKSRYLSEAEHKARMYVTHFIRVMNLAVVRGDLPPETRAYYGLAAHDSTVPMMNTQNELISWGRRMIEGEEFRIRKGGNPVTNPSIAVVKVRFEKYLDALLFNQTLDKKTSDFANNNAVLRHDADNLILSLWNEVEDHFKNLGEDDRRRECEKYGLVYFMRKSEKHVSAPGETTLSEKNVHVQH